MQKNTGVLEKRAAVFPDWVYLGLLMLAYVIVGINTYRLQPVLTTLMSYLSVDTSQVGFLMSICSFVSLCLAIPFGVVLTKLECWRAIIIAVIVEIAGSVIGAIFTTYIGIAVSQILFGLVQAIVTVCAPYLLQMVYDKKRFSNAMGYLNACQTVGMAVAYLILPMFLAGTGTAISKVWSLTIIPPVILLIGWIPIVNRKAEYEIQQRAKQRQQGETETADNGEKATVKKEKRVGTRKDIIPLKDRNVWLVVVSTFFIMFSAGAVLSFASAFLTSVRGISEGASARIVLSSAIVGMICSALTGIVCNKLGRRNVFVAVVLLLAVLRLLMVITPTGILMNIVIALQGVPAASIVVVNAVVPDLCPPVERRPLVISMISTATMAGMCLSAYIFGMMIHWWGYNNALLALIPVSLLALVGASSITSV